MDGGLEQAGATDFVCVIRVRAEPWRQCFPVPPVDIGKSEASCPMRSGICFRGIWVDLFLTA